MKTHKRYASQAGSQEDVWESKQELTRPKWAGGGKEGNVSEGRGLL